MASVSQPMSDKDPESVDFVKGEASLDRLPNANVALTHDTWFQEQVEIGLTEADDPKTAWVPHETVKEDMAKQRAMLEVQIKKSSY